MAKTTKRLNLYDTLVKVKECLTLLPGAEERQRITHIIQEIIKELDVLQESISRFPDDAETKQVSHAIQTFVTFFDTLKEKPLLAEMLLPKKTTTRKTKSSVVNIDTLQKQLEELPTEKIPEELAKYKKDVLIELSTRMNITANKKMTKNILADRIFKLGFANKRGYSLLSGE